MRSSLFFESDVSAAVDYVLEASEDRSDPATFVREVAKRLLNASEESDVVEMPAKPIERREPTCDGKGCNMENAGWHSYDCSLAEHQDE